jgi:glutamine cyclotransferase
MAFISLIEQIMEHLIWIFATFAKKNNYMFARLGFVVIALTVIGCQGVSKSRESDNSKNQSLETINKESAIPISLSYNTKKSYKTGDPVAIQYSTKSGMVADSVRLSVDGLYQQTYLLPEKEIVWESGNANPGNKMVLLTFYWNTAKHSSASISMELVSDFVPVNYTYRIKRTWPHNKKSYTQGLEFSDGFLYEGTGQYKESMLLKLDILKNEIIQSLNLPGEVFGEGITILNDKIFQLTWRSNVGYVYEKHTFTRLYEFNYPTEGWGLCNNGRDLIMSDGSSTIYFLDAEYFQEIRRIQVYNEKGPVSNLNELEFIKNEIFANVYGSEIIVAFDPLTGKVKKQIDLSGILDKSKIKDPVDVLNGIAWNSNTNQLIVTGKWWPQFFEIELVEKR